MESGRSFLLGALSFFVWTVIFFILYFLVAFIYGLLCSLPVIGGIFTFIAYSVAVNDWVIPLRDVILAFIASRLAAPVIHRLMHDRTEHAVKVTKIVCACVQAIFWIGAMVIAGDSSFTSIAQCAALLIGISIGLFVAEFRPESPREVYVLPAGSAPSAGPSRPPEFPHTFEPKVERPRVKSPADILDELEQAKAAAREVPVDNPGVSSPAGIPGEPGHSNPEAPMDKSREQAIADWLDSVERAKAEVRELQRKNANRR